MPQVALPDSLQLCKISGCLHAPFVQDQHSFMTSSLILPTTIEAFSSDAPFKILLGILGYWTLLI
jgi:hypothetical protein